MRSLTVAGRNVKVAPGSPPVAYVTVLRTECGRTLQSVAT